MNQRICGKTVSKHGYKKIFSNPKKILGLNYTDKKIF